MDDDIIVQGMGLFCSMLFAMVYAGFSVPPLTAAKHFCFKERCKNFASTIGLNFMFLSAEQKLTQSLSRIASNFSVWISIFQMISLSFTILH